MPESNYFKELNSVDVSKQVEKKNGLSYLAWAYAWGELKKRYPDATYTIYENANGLFYHTDGKTCWVKTGVTVGEIEHIEYLPVMDNRNKSITLENVTSFDVNKAIQRSLTKAVARHGLGLYIYAGEDLPEEEIQHPNKEQQEALLEMISKIGKKFEDILAVYKVKTVADMTMEQYANCLKRLQATEKKNADGKK